jgi:hypothetical protein
MKNTLALSTAAVALLSAVLPTAHAGLIGADVAYEFLTPNTSTVVDSSPSQTITTTTSFFTDGVSTTFTDDEIIITNTELAPFLTEPFIGPSYLFSGTTITNVTIDSASSSHFLGVLSVTGNNVMVNFEGLPPVPVGAEFILDVTTPSATIPEPSTWAIMALGFGLLGGASYWRRWSVAIAG